jgi:hypothetical protein
MATVTLLQMKSSFYSFQGEQFAGTATGGSTAKMTDTSLIGYTSETWPAKLDGVQIRMESGSANNDLRMVGRVDRSEGDLYAHRAFSGSVANTDTYELWGTAINGGTPLTQLFNDVMRWLRPVQDTAITIVTNQNQYDVTASVQSKRDIRGVYLRLLDPSGVQPYRIADMAPGLQWDAYDRGGGGTTAVFLNIKQALTRDDNNIQLWMRAETGFTALASDASTVDAVYRDWLAWEALLELSQRKLNAGTGDKARWTGLRDRAIEEAGDGRNRWIPREPIHIGTFW